MARPTSKPNWATTTKTDPYTGLPNKVQPSSTKQTDGYYHAEKPTVNWENWWRNNVYEWVDYFDTAMQREVTLVIASTDSNTESQNGADIIINTSDSCETQIQEAIDSLGTMGGTIKFMEGTFNFRNDTGGVLISVKNNVNIIGSGMGTLFKMLNTISMAYIFGSDTTNSILKDFMIDGNRSNGNNASGLYNFRNNCRLINIYVKNIYLKSFDACDNLRNCYTYGNGSSNSYGAFDTCKHLQNCVADSGTYNGFKNCNYLNDCVASNNTTAGFSVCEYLNNCTANNNATNGFDACKQLSNCYGYSNTQNGFYNSYRLTNCVGSTNTQDGFESCKHITNCIAQSNTTNGYQNCKSMGFNEASVNGTAYVTCYADSGTGNAVADTAAGGYNH